MAAGPLLIVVHPGSLCGSASMHLGGSLASEVRTAIAQEIAEWSGPVAIVTGNFEDEIAGHGCLSDALKRAAFTTDGEPFGDTLTAAAKRIARHFALKPKARVRVTGAWADNDGTGCVTAVVRALKRAGYAATESENAPASDDEEGKW